MSSPNASVSTADLEEALDYLAGLVLILRHFHAEERGRVSSDLFLAILQAMDSLGMNWEPLRYQTGVGQGWGYVAENVEQLRTRLLEGYSDAAL